MSRDINTLVSEVANLCRDHLVLCAREGILLKVTQTLRTWDEQAGLYAKGRTAPGPKVTNAAAGFSWHNWGRAYDVCQATGDPYPEDDEWWEKMGALGESLGLVWGGRWHSILDRPHFEHHGGTTLAALRAERQAEFKA